MPNVNDLFPSNYLRSEDLDENETLVLTISQLKNEMVGQGREAGMKPVLYFEESKPMVLNKTNAHIIGQVHGEDYSLWRGRRIEVFTMDVQFRDDIVRGLRVRGVRQRPTAQNGYGPEQGYGPGYDRPQGAYGPPQGAYGPPQGGGGVATAQRTAPAAAPARTGVSEMQARVIELQAQARELGVKVGKPESIGTFPEWETAALDTIDGARRHAAQAAPPSHPDNPVTGSPFQDFDDSDPFADE